MQLEDATILIADDELELLEIFKRWFEREGCVVLVAHNGAVALELATHNCVDLIISDLRMPVVDGVELVKRVAPSLPYLPKMIFVSAFVDASCRALYDLGAEIMLSKPTTRRDLTGAARRCLMEREERWCIAPVIAPRQDIIMIFHSLHNALEDGLISFGYGGFCIRSETVLSVDEPLSLDIDFEKDRQKLSGQGVVRWAEDGLLGIEFEYVNDRSRDWIISLMSRNTLRSFIPGNCLADGEISTSLRTCW